ncbi:MAG: hypothetical protein J6575_07400 [Bifidobacterium sp.]|nr:hypothetical protein [Bifidobacterium sp.]
MNNQRGDKTIGEETSDSYAHTTPETIGLVLHPNREITMDDLDGIFTERPFADNPRKATLEAMRYAQERADGKVPDDSPTFGNAANAMAYLNHKAGQASD